METIIDKGNLPNADLMVSFIKVENAPLQGAGAGAAWEKLVEVYFYLDLELELVLP